MSPTFLSPATPPELLSYIVEHCVYPTTLVVCSSRSEFLSGLVNDIKPDKEPGLLGGEEEGNGPSSEMETKHKDERSDDKLEMNSRLLQAPLYQVARAKHLRMVFVPNVSHLRAFLSVFAIEDSKIGPPPPQAGLGSRLQQPSPLLLVYGFLSLHQDTSEWSAQGLGASAAELVEAARRTKLRATMVELRGALAETASSMADSVPVLGSTLRSTTDVEESGRTGRRVQVKLILGRWFTFQDVRWSSNSGASPSDHAQVGRKNSSSPV